MQIAPGFDSTAWISLQLDDETSSDWVTAVTIFDARIRERYINPVDFLIAAETEKRAVDRRFGFAVLAIDCLLVETLGAFLEGLENTEGDSKATFCKFLTTRPGFSADFSDALAKKFYSEFRCGILHQAEVGGGSKVWSVGPLIREVAEALVVNRNEFHARLKTEFARYLDELRDPRNRECRMRFRKKMNFIART